MANRISVELPRPSYYTGDVVAGSVVLETDKEVDARGLYLDVLGRESTVISRGSGKQRATYRSQADILGWRLPLHEAGVVPPGGQRVPFQFQRPLNRLPSYTGPHAKVGDVV